MKEKLAQLKIYFQNNPVMAFVAVIVLVTVVLGGIAMAGSFSGNAEDDDQVKIEEESEKETTEDTEDEEIEEEEEISVDEEDEDPTPTKKAALSPSATPTTATTPSPTPTPAEKKFSVNFLGDVYEDKNCNGSRDGDEGGLSGLTVNLFKASDNSAYKGISTNSSGHYSLSTDLKEGESLSLKAQPVIPDTHILKPGTTYNTVELKQGSTSGGQTFYLVPKANEAQCSS